MFHLTIKALAGSGRQSGVLGEYSVVSSYTASISGSGSTGERIAKLDWSQTSLGKIDNWPEVIRSTVLLILKSPLAMATLWGPDGILIYN
ncbi:MAG: hypothetical protein EON58_18670, partial [Alphaproteobacteria bacterium]